MASEEKTAISCCSVSKVFFFSFFFSLCSYFQDFVFASWARPSVCWLLFTYYHYYPKLASTLVGMEHREPSLMFCWSLSLWSCRGYALSWIIALAMASVPPPLSYPSTPSFPLQQQIASNIFHLCLWREHPCKLSSSFYFPGVRPGGWGWVEWPLAMCIPLQIKHFVL